MEPSPLDATRTAGDHPTVGCAIQQVLRRAFRAGRRATGLVATAYLVHAVPAAIAAAPPASTEESGLAEVVVTAARGPPKGPGPPRPACLRPRTSRTTYRASRCGRPARA